MSRSQQSKKANTCLTHACPALVPPRKVRLRRRLTDALLSALRLRDQHRSVRSYL
jgi:hypothetical protein